MIFHFGIDGPDVVLGGNSVEDVFNGGHCSEHGVVLIVVLMHSIATDEKEVAEVVNILANDVELVITSEICRISFGNVDDM